MSEKRQSLKILGIKKEKRVNALLDSGASTSYIDVDLVKELGIPLYDKKQKVFLGDGTYIWGNNVVFSVVIKGKIKPMIAIVIPVPEKLVIGHDFMQDNDVIIDYVKEKIKFSKRVPLKNRRMRI